MKHFLRLIAAIAAFVSLSPLAAAPVKDWAQVAARTPSGSFIQGNPNAPVKLVEYLSLTCPHCAHFESVAAVPLAAKYIKPGLVSYEVRIAVRDAFDLLAATLSRCAGPRGFFAVKPALYAAQGDWEQKASDWTASAPDLSKLSEAEAAKTAAKGAGLDAFFVKHGLPPARIDACLSDIAEQKSIGQRAEEIWKMPGFPGTPAFAINGQMTSPIAEWPDLDKALAAALAKRGRK